MSQNVIVNAIEKHTATIIFMHGLGDTGHGWSDTLAQIKPKFAKLICPTAETSPVTMNGGFPMPSWFDIKALSYNAPEDIDGIKKSTKLVHKLITDEEKAGIPSNRIILGGFSQGGALAFHAFLNWPKPLAGMIGLSTWCPIRDEVEKSTNVNLKSPVLQCHGTIDPLLPKEWALMTEQFLKKYLTNYQFKIYQGMAHSSCDKELEDVKKFIRDNLK